MKDLSRFVHSYDWLPEEALLKCVMRVTEGQCLWLWMLQNASTCLGWCTTHSSVQNSHRWLYIIQTYSRLFPRNSQPGGLNKSYCKECVYPEKDLPTSPRNAKWDTLDKAADMLYIEIIGGLALWCLEYSSIEYAYYPGKFHWIYPGYDKWYD